jgi:hypothetical protein
MISVQIEVWCPTCRAKAGTPSRTPEGYIMVGYHPGRSDNIPPKQSRFEQENWSNLNHARVNRLQNPYRKLCPDETLRVSFLYDVTVTSTEAICSSCGERMVEADPLFSNSDYTIADLSSQFRVHVESAHSPLLIN